MRFIYFFLGVLYLLHFMSNAANAAEDCPKATDLPCYKPPEQISTNYKRRRIESFETVRGSQPLIQNTRQSRSTGQTRDIAHSFSSSLKMPCGDSLAFPENFRCKSSKSSSKNAIEYNNSNEHSPILEFSKGQRGEVQVVESRSRMSLPAIIPLAPEHSGLSLHKHPTFYWYLSNSWDGFIEFTLNNGEKLETEFMTRLEQDKGFDAGIHSISLAAYQVSLKPDVEYEWFVRIMNDPDKPANDIVASGVIKYQPKLAELANSNDVNVLANAGVWYDAFDVALHQAQTQPNNPKAQDILAALLQQAFQNLPERHFVELLHSLHAFLLRDKSLP